METVKALALYQNSRFDSEQQFAFHSEALRLFFHSFIQHSAAIFLVCNKFCDKKVSWKRLCLFFYRDEGRYAMFVSLKTCLTVKRFAKNSHSCQHAPKRLDGCNVNLGVSSRALSATRFHDIKFNCLAESQLLMNRLCKEKKKNFSSALKLNFLLPVISPFHDNGPREALELPSRQNIINLPSEAFNNWQKKGKVFASFSVEQAESFLCPEPNDDKKLRRHQSRWWYVVRRSIGR